MNSLTFLIGGGYLVRNVFDFDCGEETSFWYVIKDKFIPIESFTKKNRGYINKAHNLLNISLISKKEMLSDGYEVYESAFMKYGTNKGKMSKESFYQRIESTDDSYDFWGCRVKETGKLVAFLIAHRIGNYCEYETSKANPNYLPKYYPLYGLYFERDKYYLEEQNLKFVISGSRTITKHSNIQDFLIEKFGFRKAYCRLNLKYKWWFGIIVRILYPFRRFIKIAKVQSILNMEAMARNEI